MSVTGPDSGRDGSTDREIQGPNIHQIDGGYDDDTIYFYNPEEANDEWIESDTSVVLSEMR